MPTIATINLTVKVYEQDGTVLPGASVVAKLSGPDWVDGNYVSPLEVTGVTDVNGQTILALFPNALGGRGTFYKVTCVHPTTGKSIINTRVQLPNADINLVDIDPNNIIEEQDVVLEAAAEGAASAAAAVVSAAAAASSATAAASSASGASVYATAAAASATSATSSAAAASTSASAASTSATAAASSATAAGASATAAASSASAAATSATNAATSASSASTSASAASTSATNAAASEAAAAASAASINDASLVHKATNETITGIKTFSATPIISTLTGYIKGAGASALTAAATIPNTDITGLGTMSTQAAGSVAITGGTIAGATITTSTYNGNTFTAGTGTLTIAAGKTHAINQSIALSGTDGTTMTFPTTTATIARTDAAQTFTGVQTFSSTISGSVNGNAATATALATGRAINGVTFDGTAAITVTAAAGTLTGTTLAAAVVASSLTSVGALNAGSITSGFGAIDIGTDTLAAGNTTITGTLTASTSISTGTGTTTTAGLKMLNGSDGMSSGWGSIYAESQIGAGGGTNFALAAKADGTRTLINGTTSSELFVAGAPIVVATSSGVLVTGNLIVGIRNNLTSTDRIVVAAAATTILTMRTAASSVGASGGLLVVNGYNTSVSTSSFIDLILIVASTTPVVVSSINRGSPSARTYTMSGSAAVQLAMASGTYGVSTSSVEQAS